MIWRMRACASGVILSWGNAPSASLRAARLVSAFSIVAEKVDELEAKYKDHMVYPRALNLRGDVLSAKGELEGAEAAYLTAKGLAEAQGDYSTAAESTSQLIGTDVAIAQATKDKAVEEEKYAAAAGFFDEFINKHAGHYLEPQAVANALPALIAVKRGDEGLKKMEQMIVRLGTEKNADLEKAVTTYAKNYIQNYTDETKPREKDTPNPAAQQLIDRLKKWPQDEPLPAPVRAWLLITILDTLEDKKQFPTTSTSAVNVAFDELMEMEKTELAAYPLQRIIVYLNDRDKSAEALPFADEILTRPGTEGKDVAEYFKGVSLAKSTDRANQDKAIASFNAVIDKYQSEAFTDDAMHALGMLYMKRKEWAIAEKTLFRYVSNKKLNKHNPEVWYNLGLARDAQKNYVGDRSAVSAFSKVWGKYAGHFKFSCPAMNRTIEIEMQHGTKQSAYKLSQSWLRSMAKHTEHPVAGEYLRKATAMRDDLANDPSVTVDKD